MPCRQHRLIDFITQHRRRFALLATTMLLAACASSSTQYYRLPQSDYRLPPTPPNAVLQVVLNDSLSNNGLVYQSTPTQLHFARQHQWGEALAPALAKSLANTLNQQPGRYRYTIQRSPGLPVLTVHVEAFQGQYNGHTRIAGYTSWSDAARRGRNFAVETPQHGDGYAAMVDSLNTGLQQVAVEIGE